MVNSKRYLSQDRVPVLKVCSKPSVTVKSKGSFTDIKGIVDRYVKFGQSPPIASKQGVYDDVINNVDFEEMHNTLCDMESRFYDLPYELRDKFSNDPNVFYNEVTKEDLDRFFNSANSTADGDLEDININANKNANNKSSSKSPKQLNIEDELNKKSSSDEDARAGSA